MKVPESYCCNCFQKQPEKRYTHSSSVTLETMRLTHKMRIPFCTSCHSRVRLGLFLNVIMSIATIGIVILLFVASIGSEVTSIVVTIGVIVGAIVAPILTVMTINHILNINFVKVTVNPSGAEVKFHHPEYQKLFAAASIRQQEELLATPNRFAEIQNRERLS